MVSVELSSLETFVHELVRNEKKRIVNSVSILFGVNFFMAYKLISSFAKIELSVGSLYQPFSQIPFLRIKGDANLYQLSAIHGVGKQITFIVNLPQSLFRGAVQLELKNIEVVCCLYYSIGTAGSGTHFCLRKLSHKLEYEVEHDLVVALRLLVQFVWEIGEEAGEAGEESLCLTRFQLMDELADIK